MSSSSSTKLCFNSNCNDVLERSRKGWRRRTGEFADLCDRCASAYEEGKFCETFHLNASGWRCCESCGKQIHCGCIVSFHMFVLLDAGGIECISCARKSFILTPNPAWPPPSLYLPVMPERIKDVSGKNWSHIAGSAPMAWHQAASLFSSSSAQSDIQQRKPFESSGIERLISSERMSASSLEKKKAENSPERLIKLGASEFLENGNEGLSCVEQANSCANVPHQPAFSKNDLSTSHLGVTVSSASPNEGNDLKIVFGSQTQRSTHSPLAGKQCSGHNAPESSGETQIRSGRPRSDARARNQLLPRYWPRITDQELQQISGDSNSVITPLFEKMLSASDAGRIGRLVLPKKCAEAYFPPISQPEGLPLKVQDLKGKEWIFQFRFWPNNNSRMYVLEGVTPCMQSMQLQAGDIVTFSRMEPEGKLVMGCRKASSAPPCDEGNGNVNVSNGVSANGDVSVRKTKPGEVLSAPHQLKVSPGFPPDQSSHWPKDKSGCTAKEVVGAKSSSAAKRKNSTVGSKSKRLKTGNEDLIELKLTWEQAQGLLRAPPKCAPTVVVIEGLELEEYEDAPIVGRPTIFAIDCMGEQIQWAQCEDCFKWRKVPVDAFLPSVWICSENSWDLERSSCSAAQELTAEQLEDLLHTSSRAASKEMESTKEDPDSVEALEGLDALANLAIQEEGETLSPSSQATTKHPRHRPGCSCIVCIQPPSGKGPKHKQTCTCNVCLTVKRRFRTLMLRREKKQSEKEAETARQKLQTHHHCPERLSDDDIQLYTDMGNSSPNYNIVRTEDPDNDLSRMRSSLSPFKGQIDLNIQPERDEELSPGSDSGSMMTEKYLGQQKLPSSNNINLSGFQTHLSSIGVGGNSCNNIALEAECSLPLSTGPPAPKSGTER